MKSSWVYYHQKKEKLENTRKLYTDRQTFILVRFYCEFYHLFFCFSPFKPTYRLVYQHKNFPYSFHFSINFIMSPSSLCFPFFHFHPIQIHPAHKRETSWNSLAWGSGSIASIILCIWCIRGASNIISLVINRVRDDRGGILYFIFAILPVEYIRA